MSLKRYRWYTIYEAWKRRENDSSFKRLVRGFFNRLNRKHKKKILERDGNKCVACGRSDSLELSHIKPLRGKHFFESLFSKFEYGVIKEEDIDKAICEMEENYYSPFNLVILCKDCHIACHVGIFDFKSPYWERRKYVRDKVRKKIQDLYGKES